MKKFTFGIPDEFAPSRFSRALNYTETETKITKDFFKTKKTKAGFVIEFPLENGTQIFGFGLQLKQFNHTGSRIKLCVNSDPVSKNGDSHAPVPFFATNKGYGMYFDTSRYAEFYCGKVKKAERARSEILPEGGGDTEAELYKMRKESGVVMSVLIPASEGIDIYVFEGEKIVDIVKQYNMLAGGGCDVPEWGLGMQYRCFNRWNSQKIIETAEHLKEKNIPCSMIGVEPGWHSHKYPCTFEWALNNFPDPDAFLQKMKELGLHVNLWEHAYTHPESCLFEPLYPYSADYLLWGGLIPDFAKEEARKIFTDHHKKLVKQGVDGFKLDECDSGDYVGSWGFPLLTEFPSGLDGEQYHSMFGVLYAQVLLDALEEKPTYSLIRQMGALAAPYPFVLYSDLYDPNDFVRGVVNSGFSGLLWTPEFRQCWNKKECIRRLQAVAFSAMCLVNAWNYDGIPWEMLDCEDEVREIFEERYRLIPRLKKAFEKYNKEGVPPIRALVMDYTFDVETYQIDNEWLLGDDLLVAPITTWESDERKVYLPRESEWVDYYTNEPVESGWSDVINQKIPVFRKIK